MTGALLITFAKPRDIKFHGDGGGKRKQMMELAFHVWSFFINIVAMHGRELKRKKIIGWRMDG